MRKRDIEAVGELTGSALAAGGALLHELHSGIAGRPFGILGSWAAPVRLVHDEIARAVYGGVRGTLRAGSRAGAGALALHADPDAPALATTRGGSAAVGALNGLYGDHLTASGNELALTLAIRRHGAEVPVTPAGLAAAYPDATSRVAVFVHGLCETDEAWRGIPPRRGRTYGERLQDELSYTPVLLRFNSGRRVSDNGRALSRLLDDLVAGWPGGAQELVLVGHSMGGLVARSACHYGEADGLRFADAVRHVVCLGTPHLGADLEKGVHVLDWALGRLPETRALATLLRARSAGIQDLRFGACIEEDWRDADPDEFLRDRCGEVPFLPGAHYAFIGARVTAGPAGAVLGDLLVRSPSASGRGRHRRIPFDADRGRELTGLTHFDLLNHPDVYAQLRTWLGGVG